MQRKWDRCEANLLELTSNPDAQCEALTDFKSRFDSARSVVEPELAHLVGLEAKRLAAEKAARLASVKQLMLENQALPAQLDNAVAASAKELKAAVEES